MRAATWFRTWPSRDRRRSAPTTDSFLFARSGMAPQDLTYAGEPTRLEIGDHNTIREFVTINRGTIKGGGLTRVGNHTLVMAYTHIAHDCQIGDHVILANAATLGGHVTVGDWAQVGALCPVHHFVRIGEYAFVGGGTTITRDVLPFSKTAAGARYSRLRTQRGRTGAARFQQRADRQDPSCLQGAAGVETQHFAGAGEIEVRSRPGRRCGAADQVHRGVGAGSD